MSGNIFIYAVRDEDSTKGFIFVASETEIDVENSKADKAEVFHVHSDKKKPYHYTISKKATNVKLSDFMSVVDDELYQYNSKTKIVVFESKKYDNLISQLMDDLEEEQNSDQDDESEDDGKKKNKKKTTKQGTKSEVTTVRQRGRPKGTQPKKSESESYQEDEDDGEKEAPKKGRGRPKKFQNEEDEDIEEEKSIVKGKRGRPSKTANKSFKEDKSKVKDDDDDEDEDKEIDQNEENDNEISEEESIPKSKRGRKPNEKPVVEAKKTNKKQAKKLSESEVNEEEDDEEEDKPTQKKGANKKQEKFKKGSNNPNIPNIIQVDETFEGNSQDINDSCCSFCTNRELIRAVQTGNHTLLKKLVQSKGKISTIFAKRGPDSDETVLEIILKNKDKKALEIIIAALQKKSDLSLTSNPECSLDEVNTGYNDRFAYGVPTRKVNVSRGGKEGNNAFVADINSFVDTASWHEDQRLIYSLLENETEVQFLEFLRGLKDESLSNSLIEKTYVAVRAGNRKTAAYLIKQANKFGGYGFNSVHEQVLTLDNPSKMEEFRKVSATKKSQGVYSNNSYGYGGAQGVITPIHCAAINPNPEFIKKLLDIAPEFSIPDDMMRKPVHYAATCEGPGPLSYLIKQGVDTREGDKKKITPLMLAAQFGRSKNIEILLQANGKSNPDSRTREGMRAIHFAAHYGHLECVKLLIEEGEVDVDTPGVKRMTPLHIATSRGHYEIVEYLLSQGAKLTAKDKFRRSAVIHATANGQLKILSLLLKNGGPFNDPDSSNNTPVHYAAAYGFQACLDLLKQAGANFNPQNSWNLTPLSVSMAKGHFGMVKKLLNYPECDVNCTDVKGRTIISRATEKLNLHNIEQFEFILKEKKANPNMSDLKGQSPLHYLCNLSKADFINKRQKEENKYNVTKKYEEEYEKLIEKATQILLDCGADINKLNTKEQSPLIISILKKNFFILNILLKKGGIQFKFVNKIDQNIFHILSNLISEGPNGIEKFKSLFDEIKKDKEINIKEYINMVDYQGFTPLLLYVKAFSENATTYRTKKLEEIKREIFEKKGGKSKKSSKSKRNHQSGFGDDGSLIQLTEKELEKAQQQAEESLEHFEKDFQKLITFLKSQGANTESKVQKIKIYRERMDQGQNYEIEEEKEERYNNYSEQDSDIEINQNNDNDNNDDNEDNSSNSNEESDSSSNNSSEDSNDEDEDNDSNEDEQNEKSEKKIKRDKMGNPYFEKKVNYKSHYNYYGENNMFNLALSHLSLNYLKFFVQEYPQLVNNLDYLKRNILTQFILQNQDNQKNKQENVLKIFKWLLTLKIKINNRDTLLSTPLISAVSQKKYKFARVLIEAKADLDVKDFFGQTPLIMAINNIKSNNLEFVEYLLNKGANPNFCDNYGRSSLHHAVNVADKGANASFDLENLLIKFGADVNQQDSLGRTPLHYCFVQLNELSYKDVIYDPFETVSSLCNHPSIKIDVKDNLQKTPLHYAAQKNSTISAIYMVEKGANINSEDINGNTPLSIAFRFQRSEITTTFIQNKADTSKMITILKQLKDETKNNYSKKLKYNEEESDVQDSSDAKIQKNLLKQYQLKSDSYDILIQKMLSKEEVMNKFGDKLVFDEFKKKGNMPVGKSSFFKAAITYQWQGIAYLLLIKSNYNLFNALEDAISIDLYQLAITLLNKYPNDKTVVQVNSEEQNLLHILSKRPVKDANLQGKLFDTLMARQVTHKKLDSKNNSCLHYAYLHPLLTTKILDLGLDCNLLNKEENSPFTYAIQQNSEKAIKQYTNYAPNYNKKFRAKANGFNESLMYTPLVFQFANKVKDLSLLSKFLSNGSNINETDSLGRSSLYYAIYHNSAKLVKFILQSKKLDIKHVDNFGKNPIHYVINPVEFGSYENTEILELLHNAKFDFNVKDKSGNTPMSYALQQDSQKMVEALKKYNVEAPKDNKKLPKRAPTSIVAIADFPEEEVDYEEDSKKFTEESGYDQYKEFYKKNYERNIVRLDNYVSEQYKKSQNYVVVDKNNEAYNLLMVKVDLGHGGYPTYVFYIMQIIHDINSGVFILYTRWGQINQMGQMQHTPFPTKEAAIKEFTKIFQQKSGNEWENKHNFRKQDKKYQLVVFEKSNDKKSFAVQPYNFDNLVTKPSLLDKPIQEFIQIISNAEIFKAAYNDLNLSDSYFPLAQLSKSALIEAQNILAELFDFAQEQDKLRNNLTKGNNMQKLLENEYKIMQLSSRYYELIPRDISKWEPIAPLTTDYTIGTEQQLIENLLDFEAAIKIIMGSYTKLAIQHPLDYCYSSLNIRMKQIEIEHPEYKMIHQYISRTNKKVNHPQSKYIKNIFAVERRGEAEKMKQFQSYQKKLLWHGSGVQNYLSILSSGLRINGVNAQQSGSSLGCGIYFADLFEKASHYAKNMDGGVNSKTRLILLCEVAVGKEQQIKNNTHYRQYAKSEYQLLKGFNSVKLVGNKCPDEKKNLILPNGTIAPIGPIIEYNEEVKKINSQSKIKKPQQQKSKKQNKPVKSIKPKKSTKIMKKKYQNDDDDESEDSNNSISDNEEIDIEENEDDNDEEDDHDENDDMNNNEQEDEEEEEEDYYEIGTNYNYGNVYPGEQKKNTPFNQLFTSYLHSEYVVFNPAQVRIRYLIEINDD